jgi:integrase
MAAYHEAWATRKSSGIKPNTLSWLIEEKFLKSQHFKKMDLNTQEQYGWIIPSIEKEFSDFPLGALKDRRTRALFIEWRDSIADGTCKTLVSKPSRPRKPSTSMADIHLEKLAAILSWGVKNGLIDFNPCTGIEKLHDGSRLDKVWSWEQEGTFLAEARPDLVEAFLLGIWTGFREGDCIDLRLSNYDGKFIRRELLKRPRPNKPRKPVMFPVGGPFKPVLDAMVRRTGLDGADPEARASTKILRNSEGQPWASEDSFYRAFKRECDRLGIKDRTFHDLRRTAVVRLAIAGCTEPEIASITGHSIRDVRSILEKHYLYLDPQIAINAMTKLEDSTVKVYAQPLRQFMKGRLRGSESGAERPTKRPTALLGSPLVRKKT